MREIKIKQLSNDRTQITVDRNMIVLKSREELKALALKLLALMSTDEEPK